MALLDGPEGLYLGGEPGSDVDYAALAALIPGWAYLYPSEGWLAALPQVLPHRYFQRHARLYFCWSRTAVPEVAVPEGFTLVQNIDEPMDWSVLLDGRIVGHCRPDLRIGDYVELGVWTRPDMRRRGLASAALRACLGSAKVAGIARVGWHCHASNFRSVAMARRSGFILVGRYSAWSASIPGENSGDLPPDICRALAAGFEAGRDEIGWLDFHAAAAWCETGELNKALAAIERLVSGDWSGKPDWLADHWALRQLRDDPRFVAALAIQTSK